MTVYWRDGFWRMGSNGTYHEVAGHWVSRDEWDRSSSGPDDYRNYYIEQLREARVNRNPTAALVNPNAECPVCAQPVFFFQNQFGSRVYFDDLGPPWPKHPCTDHVAKALPVEEKSFDVISPPLRAKQDIREIARWLRYAEIDLESEFSTKYGLGRWTPWIVKGRFRGGRNVLLVLESADQSTSKRLFMMQKHVRRCFSVGVIVYQHRNWLMCFDLELMKHEELEFQRLSGASAFVDQLTLVEKKKRKAVNPATSPAPD